MIWMAQIEPEGRAPGDFAATMPPATARLMQNTEGAEHSVERLALAHGQLSARRRRWRAASFR